MVARRNVAQGRHFAVRRVIRPSGGYLTHHRMFLLGLDFQLTTGWFPDLMKIFAIVLLVARRHLEAAIDRRHPGQHRGDVAVVLVEFCPEFPN